MTARWRPGPEHRREAVQRLFTGLIRGDDVVELAKAIADLHPKDNTFPGELFISIAVDALDAAGIDRDAPLLYEGLREEHLAECRLRGRDNKKIQFASWRSAPRAAASSQTFSTRWAGGRPTTSGGSPWRLPWPSSAAARIASASPCLGS